jgi:3-oxoacyl-[acyl-carrier protein] reductase
MTTDAAHRLDGRVALITGSGAGMGRAHAIMMAERGADVVIMDVNREAAEDTAKICRQHGQKALAFGHDIQDLAKNDAMVSEATRALGSIDILVNNAGIGGGRKKLEEIDEAIYDRMMGVHLTGHFFITKAVVPKMKERRWGSIVNISSRWAMTGADNSSHYIAFKTSLLGLTKAWAKEFAPWNIRVNAVAPGGVWTDMVLRSAGEAFIREEEKKVPLKRWAQPEEYAYAVCFLASDEASFITGQTLSPNGGMSIVGL